jgi:hypothetical protein
MANAVSPVCAHILDQTINLGAVRTDDLDAIEMLLGHTVDRGGFADRCSIGNRLDLFRCSHRQ